MRRLHLTCLSMALLLSSLGAGLVPAPARAADGPEWQHELWIAAQLNQKTPTSPVVLLLGGSSGREATVSDASWAADVLQRGGTPVITYSLAARRQTFEQEIALVKALPRIPMLIFIGVSGGRFTSAFTTTTDTTPPAAKPSYVRHHYRSANRWTPERKQERVEYWLSRRYPLFKERYATHLAQLEQLIATCVQRGYSPVVLALPRNIEAMGDALDAPTAKYLGDGRRLAMKHGVPFVDFVPELQLSSDDFYDLDHLVESGRPKYQARLADETVELLTASWIATMTEEQAGGEPGEPAASRGGLLWPAALGAVLLGVALAAWRRRSVTRRRGLQRRPRRRSGPRAPAPPGRKPDPPDRNDWPDATGHPRET